MRSLLFSSQSFILAIYSSLSDSRMMVYTVSTERKNILEQVTRDISEPLLLLRKIRHLKRQANTKKTVSLTEKQRNVIRRCQETTKSRASIPLHSEVTTPEKNDNRVYR